MRLMYFGLMVGLLGCAAQAGPPSQPPAATSDDTQPIPTDLGAEVQMASKLGQAIFNQDQASWKATDAMLAQTHGKPDPRMHGWVTLEDGAGFRVIFVGTVQDHPLAFYEVRLGGQQAPRVSVIDPPAPVDPDVAVRYKALSAVDPPSDPNFLLCSKTYNSIVLPASLVGKQGWLVYLLAATTEPGVVVIGGHHRFLLSSDATRIVEHTPLSRSCLSAPQKAPPGSQVAGIVASHLVTAAPIETHVFLSLEHHVPMYVSTSRGAWRVDGPNISYLGKK